MLQVECTRTYAPVIDYHVHYSVSKITVIKIQTVEKSVRWHENGALDNPAMVEYVLAQSGQPDLVFAAHSMGGTTFFVMAAERPDLAAKVRAAFLFAPAVFMTHTQDKSLLAVQPVVNVSQVSQRPPQNKQPLPLAKMPYTFLTLTFSLSGPLECGGGVP